MSPLRLAQLVVHPVKGCRGVQLQRCAITDAGLQWDRQWMVVSSAGRFCTQRTHSKLALVAVALPPEAELSSWGEQLAADACLALSAPGMPPLHVRLAPTTRDAPRTAVTVWEWSGEANDEGDDAGVWFSTFLGQPGLRLVRFAANARRLTDPTYAQQPTLFSDGFPFLVISEASLDGLNARLEAPVPMNRFRPNLIVGGARQFEEDEWARFRVGGATFRSVKPCSRCKVTTIDQATAVDGVEPLRALSSFRSGAALRWRDPQPGAGDAWRAQVFFGWNLVCEQQGVLAVGDAIEVLERRDWAALGDAAGGA